MNEIQNSLHALKVSRLIMCFIKIECNIFALSAIIGVMIESIVDTHAADGNDELVARARVESDALSALYDRYYRRIPVYCQRRLFCADAAQDITSEVFLAVAKQISTFADTTDAAFYRWIYAIATNHQGRAVVMIRNVKIAAVVIGVIALCLVSGLFDRGPGSGIAFGEVMELFYRVDSYHIKVVSDGITGHVWAKRPNKIRFVEVEDVDYCISNGKDSWVVDIPRKKAVKRPSDFYQRAQRLNIDVVDLFITPSNDRLSGYYAEHPITQATIDGVLYDKYESDITDARSKTHFEALVNADTQFLYWMKMEIHTEGKREQVHEVTVLDYNIDIPDEKFGFTCPPGLTLVTEEPEQVTKKPVDVQPKQTADSGSTVSGRIVWAASGKPVASARVELDSIRPVILNGKFTKDFRRLTTTNSTGQWEFKGLPTMVARISIRSWAKSWPAMPEFNSNIGSPKDPKIGIDGQRDYTNINFSVHKPQAFYSRLKMHFTDEQGAPVKGVRAFLESPKGYSSYWENVLTPYPDRQPLYSDSRGDLIAETMWPTMNPVRIGVFPPKDRLDLIQRKIYGKDVFTVGINQEYHVSLTIPFTRKMMIKVVDPNEHPIEGISLKAWSKTNGLFQFYPKRGKDTPLLLTDVNGLAVIDMLTPGESIIVLAECIDSNKEPEKDAKNNYSPPGQDVLYAACKRFQAPDDVNDVPTYTLVMEQRPSLVMCSEVLDERYKYGWSRHAYWTCLVTGQYDQPGSGPLKHYKYNDTIYRLVPSGDIAIHNELENVATGEVKYIGMNLHTKPGMIYEVVLTGSGGKVVSVTSME